SRTHPTSRDARRSTSRSCRVRPRVKNRMMAATLAAHGEPMIARRDSLLVDRYFRYSGVTEYDVFPDKQHFLMLRPINDRSIGSGLAVILNWPRMLEKVAAEKGR